LLLFAAVLSPNVESYLTDEVARRLRGGAGGEEKGVDVVGENDGDKERGREKGSALDA
jgi:hypothetical protein